MKITKKRAILILIILLIPISIYLCIKIYYIYPALKTTTYYDTYNNLSKSLNENEIFTITKKEYDNYLTYENISIADLDNFEIVDESVYTNSYTNEDKTGSIVIGINQFDLYYVINEKTKDDFSISFDSITSFDFDYSSEMKDYIDENNINNTLDVLYYIKNNEITFPNIFTSVKEIKTNYYLSYLSTLLISNEATLINGDYEGYQYLSGGAYINYIIKNDICYEVILIGEYFTDNPDNIQNILDSIIIE